MKITLAHSHFVKVNVTTSRAVPQVLTPPEQVYRLAVDKGYHGTQNEFYQSLADDPLIHYLLAKG